MMPRDRFDEMITDSITTTGQDIRADLIRTLCEWVPECFGKHDEAARAVDDYIARHKDEIMRMDLSPDSDLKECARKAEPLAG